MAERSLQTVAHGGVNFEWQAALIVTRRIERIGHENITKLLNRPSLGPDIIVKVIRSTSNKHRFYLWERSKGLNKISFLRSTDPDQSTHLGWMILIPVFAAKDFIEPFYRFHRLTQYALEFWRVFFLFSQYCLVWFTSLQLFNVLTRIIK